MESNVHSYIKSNNNLPGGQLSLSINSNNFGQINKIINNDPQIKSLSVQVNVPIKQLNIMPLDGKNQREPRVNLIEGPNTNEYFGHGSENDQIEKNDLIQGPADPYYNNNGEQEFCEGYGEWGHVITRNERSILHDLKQYSFPDDIKNQADVIYHKMKYQVRRGKIRFQMIFYCVYSAHLELERDVDPVKLGSIFGLTQGEVQRCSSLFSPLQTGYRPPSKHASPLGYLPDYCKEMEISTDAAEDMISISSSILKRDSTLYQENPQTVAAGLLKYYIVTNGITCDDPQKITRITSRSNVTIDGMFRKIATIDNN